MEINISEPVSVKDIKFGGRKGSSKYQPIIDATLDLEPGQAFTIEVVDEDVSAFANRLGSVFRKLDLAEGVRISKRITEDGKLAICCFDTADDED